MADPTLLNLSIALLVASGFSLLSYGINVLDKRGAALAFVLALAIILAPGLEGAQGYLWLLLLILFVFIGFVITKMFWQVKQKARA